MQIFPCPFCGPRDEREFHLAGEAGKIRPDTTGTITASEWSTYLHVQRNDMGATREIWTHLPCQEVFLLERNSVTMEVIGATEFRKSGSQEMKT
ncbi:sarcosine oxidase subunit delta [Planktotalea frisia]|nr:sarcosine oxidase subunit delta [Planktotalea frisia]